MIVTNIEIAEYIKDHQTVKAKDFQERFGSLGTEILRWLDEEEITTGHRRKLTMPIEEAYSEIMAMPETFSTEERSGYGASLFVQPRNLFRVLEDPSGLFRVGAEFPADQVWGPDRDLPDKDELPTGLLMYYVENGKVIGLFEHPGFYVELD